MLATHYTALRQFSFQCSIASALCRKRQQNIRDLSVAHTRLLIPTLTFNILSKIITSRARKV
ncbi:hypothetical protein JYU34_014760 [Plutella xylostella]|uniref:Uncharacterized protein n=1 Tax=Plutella xylostella TaxID=51655 RepID=A0ABQ7Q948_PLUXY|nr:hypothetical protein JYU34_014760 [Plutella xylostella]